jgi:hypothetical protein
VIDCRDNNILVVLAPENSTIFSSQKKIQLVPHLILASIKAIDRRDYSMVITAALCEYLVPPLPHFYLLETQVMSVLVLVVPA